MYEVKIVSSLEKCFLDQKIGDFEALSFIRMMKNQRLSVQFLYTSTGEDVPLRAMLALKIEGSLAACAQARTVEMEPVYLSVDPSALAVDDNYLRTAPGLYPDWLQPLHYGGTLSVMRDQLRAVWIDFDPQDTLPAGTYPMTVSLMAGDQAVASASLTVDMLDADLPPQDMLVTQWFHCDCLANYYHCEPWSERHWEIVENFARVAVKNGINLLLTPLFTPPLDTQVGGERTTVQLLDVTVTDGQYSFGFDKLDRWIDMCDRVGVTHFEISHLFTQWGAGHAPKVMATVDGVYKRIFGWDTDATGPEYTRFLRTMLPAFLAHMKARGDDQRCLFHISDEPGVEHLEQYRRSKAVVADILEGYTIMDALSNYDFYSQGVVSTPIPSNDHIQPFLDGGVKGLWTYYCCGQCVGVSNRLLCMPSCRNRSIGMQFFKYDIAGFLQWGFNFYNNMSSVDTINPYADPSGEYWVPAGDPFSVYPAQDGTALESLRLIVFHEALEDVRAMKLCASFYGKDFVVAEIEKVFGEPVTFSRCARTAKQMLAVRARIDQLIAEALDK
ncbi:MAG: DUF4091 domain-containing protein [Eubacteriales bacterium]